MSTNAEQQPPISFSLKSTKRENEEFYAALLFRDHGSCVCYFLLSSCGKCRTFPFHSPILLLNFNRQGPFHNIDVHKAYVEYVSMNTRTDTWHDCYRKCKRTLRYDNCNKRRCGRFFFLIHVHMSGATTSSGPLAFTGKNTRTRTNAFSGRLRKTMSSRLHWITSEIFFYTFL